MSKPKVLKFKQRIVASLPDVAESNDIVYMTRVPRKVNQYDQYIWLNGRFTYVGKGPVGSFSDEQLNQFRFNRRRKTKKQKAIEGCKLDNLSKGSVHNAYMNSRIYNQAIENYGMNVSTSYQSRYVD